MSLVSLLVACGPDPVSDPADGGAESAWSGEVSLDADLTIAAGDTLRIAPGTHVTVAEGVALHIEGGIEAIGTAEAPITFAGAGWSGIGMVAGSEPAVFEGVDTYASGSILEYVTIEGATRGMELDGASPYLHAVTFRGNEIPATVEIIGGAGLLVRNGATPRIRGCTFEDNVANLFAYGGALYVDDADPIVQDSTFSQNVGSYGGAIATNRMAAPIVGSTFSGNDTLSAGGAISLVSSVTPLLANTITANHAVTDGAGVHVCVDCDPHAAPSMMDNVITDNLSDAADPDDGAAGVGAAFIGSMVSNELRGNLRDGVPSDFSWFNLLEEAWPSWVANPTVADTWWGTEDLASIEASIWDGADSDRYTTVVVEAPRTGPVVAPSPRVVLASRRAVYEYPEEVPVFLTLYNPGAARITTLTITRDGEVYDGELTYPGATREGDSWTLEMPENTVWFATLQSTSWDGAPSPEVRWEATLSDDAGPIGVPATARYAFEPAG